MAPTYGERRFSGLGCENLSLPVGTSSGVKFVVLKTAEAYDARVRGPNRKVQFLRHPGVACTATGRADAETPTRVPEGERRPILGVVASLTLAGWLPCGCDTYRQRGFRHPQVAVALGYARIRVHRGAPNA